MGVCLEITTGEDGVVERGRLVEVIGETKKGKKMRRRSAWRVKKRMKKVIREDGEFRGSSVRAMDDFTRTCSGYYLGRENEKKIESRDFLPSFLFFFS